MNYIDLNNLFEKILGAPIGRGCTRIVYGGKSGKYVFKVPRGNSGELDNQVEAFVSTKGYAKFLDDDGKTIMALVAKSRLMEYKGFKVLCMEKVEPDDDVNTWDSGGQKGLNRRGQEVCYDYAWADNVK